MGNMELLAPAGSPETLRAVLAAGADAVYVGGAQFGARAYAKNFTEEELKDAIDYTHLMGKRLHLTVNTLLKNRELEEQLYDYFLPFYEQGVDAVIVQDAGVFSFIRQYFPAVELHVSTQMTITGADGARFWKDAGADRIVLARELSLEELRDIHEQVEIELECFAHGALCYCYSGQCLFSSLLGGRSGNRGRCAQPCRLPYSVAGDAGPFSGAKKAKGQELYPLSLRDLCTIDFLPELARAGVSSLKIEGRMKQTGYAAGVTEIYRHYLDLLEAGGDYAVAESDRQRLLALGNRDGFTSGYLRGETGRSMISVKSPKHTAKACEWTAPAAGKRKIRGHVRCAAGERITLSLTDAESKTVITGTGGVAETALRAPTGAAEVEQVLRRTGDTVFLMDELTVELMEGCFIPKQFLKTLRREALSTLREAVLKGFRRNAPEYIPSPDSLKKVKGTGRKELLVVCDTAAQLRVCVRRAFVGTAALRLQSYAQAELLAVLEEAAELCRKFHKKLMLAFPPVLRRDAVRAYEQLWICIEKMQKDGQVEGFLAKNYDSLGFLKRMGARQVWLDASLYTFSNRAGEFFRQLGYEKQMLPLELNAKELRRRAGEGSILTIYGHAPFMVSAQCVNKTVYGCDGRMKQLFLTDRCGKRLPVKNYCGVCCNVIYNALPTVLFDKAAQGEVEKIAPSMLCMDFTVEDAAAVAAVLDAYEQCTANGESTLLGETTRGHFKRGVE